MNSEQEMPFILQRLNVLLNGFQGSASVLRTDTDP